MERGTKATTEATAPLRRRQWLIGRDPGQAGKRILWGGVAGLVAAGINFIVIMATYFGDPAVEGVVQPGGLPFLLVLAEAGALMVLSVGTLNRVRAAAALLLAWHLVSKLSLLGLAIFGWGPGSLHPLYLVLNVLFAYLFFQGWRGTLTWHYLTHPEYPEAQRSAKDEGPC